MTDPFFFFFSLAEELALLRHHGAPSFFAFNQPDCSMTRRVAIFAFREFVGQGKAYDSSKPHIGLLGRWQAVHHRHIRQQSLYTVCVAERDGMLVFASHEDADASRPFANMGLTFDEITKFEIPGSERKKALDDLMRMNVTEFSLFDTTDALVRTVSRFTEAPD